MEALEGGGTFGRFQVERLLGRGGMGAVYAAFDSRLERHVALKVLAPSEHTDTDAQQRRLLREARIAARLTHPNIATVYEVDEVDGQLCIVMELLEGVPLRRVLRERKVDVDEALAIARDIARALGKAHAAGVTHRDIKPENVFVTYPSPDTVLARVLDFGLARQRTAAPEGGRAEATGSHTFAGWGSPGYVSPEQALDRPVDVRTDVFSCGVVLYEMLAGIRPFRGATAVETMLAAAKTEPRPLREIVPTLPADVDAVVRCCLAKEPAGRYADGHALAAALEACLRTTAPGGMRSAIGSRPSFASIDVAAPSGPEAAAAATDALPVVDEAPTLGDAMVIGRGSQDPPAAVDRPRGPRLARAALVAAAVLVAVAGVSLVVLRGRPAPPPPAEPAAAAGSATPPTGEVSAPAAGGSTTPASGEAAGSASGAPSALELSAEPLPAAEPAVVLEAASAVAEPARPAPAPHASSPARPRPIKRDDCREKFTYDHGVKIPKRHCL